MLFCKLQNRHSIMEQKEQLCPVCRTNDMLSRLELCQINLTTAVYMCKHRGCVYPKGYTWIYVDRNIYDNNTSDDDSDFEHDLILNEMNSNNIDKCDIPSKLIELRTNLDANLEIKQNSDILQNIQTSMPLKLDEFKTNQLNITDKNATQMKNVINIDTTSLLEFNLNQILDAPVILAGSDEHKTLIQNENIKSPNRVIKILRVDKLPSSNLIKIKPSNDIKNMLLKLAQTTKESKDGFDNQVLKRIETTKDIQVEIQTEENNQDAQTIIGVRSFKSINTEAQVQMKKINVSKETKSNASNHKEIEVLENKLDLASVFTRKYNYKCKLDKVKPKKLRTSLVKQVKQSSKTPNITNIINGHSKHINKASTFEGFQFHTNIIKPAKLNTENIQKINIDKPVLVAEVEKETRQSTEKKDEFEKLVLDDFFSNLDNIQPVPVPENTVTDIDDWLHNL